MYLTIAAEIFILYFNMIFSLISIWIEIHAEVRLCDKKSLVV